MKTMPKAVSSVIMLALITGSGSALAQELNPNGFPSGEHYNLNIIGKKLDYNCTPVEYDEAGIPVYGNVIFVPETGTGIQILIKSGSNKKGKAAELYQQFQVTDACAPGFDGSPAVVQLPPSENGYRVYARALAKPVASWVLHTNTVYAAQDEYGNDLMYLGLVKSTSVQNDEGVTVVRNKGKSTALDITTLFEYTGEVCNIAFPDSGLTVTGVKRLCWIDGDFDGALSGGDFFSPADPALALGDVCDTMLCWTDGDLDDLIEAGELSRPNADDTCTTGLLTAVSGAVTDVQVSCVNYSENPEWIFNIAELVDSSWFIDNNGSKLIQIRFYPQ